MALIGETESRPGLIGYEETNKPLYSEFETENNLFLYNKDNIVNGFPIKISGVYNMDDINNNNDKQYNKNMINCLNKRSDLFKYIFGTNYILKGCHIVEIVINKLNNFNDNVLVVETGRSNVNMINKLKRHLWTSIIDVYNNFINDFKDTFWKSIIVQETFDMINNSPYKSFQFPTSTINKNDHSNNNSNNNIGENKKNGRNNSTTRNSMKSNKNDLDYVNKQHQRLKQIHAKMNVTNAFGA